MKYSRMNSIRLMYRDIVSTKYMSKGSSILIISKILNYLSVLCPSLNPYLLRIHSKLGKENYLIENSLGKFLVNPSNDSSWITSLYFEYRLKDFFITKQKKIFLDIGSNLGIYSIFCAKHGFRDVYSFEANPDTYLKQHKIIKLNNLLEKIHLVNKAISSTTSKLLFEKNISCPGQSRLFDSLSSHHNKESTVIEVESINLDYFIATNDIALEDINLIKIDVEGFEYDVLCGMRNTLNSLSKGTKIILEIWSDSPSKTKILQLLSDSGYANIAVILDDFIFEKL